MRVASLPVLLLATAVLSPGACGAGGGARETGPTRVGADEAVTMALADAVKLTRQGRLGEAERRLAEARARALDDPVLLERLDYYLATVMAYRGELGRAQRLLGAHAQRATQRGDADSAAWMRSSAAWLRWAAGDTLGAIAESERINQTIGADGELDAIDRRALLLAQLWDRALFMLDHARTVPEDERAAALARATQARDDFEALAREPDDLDLLALLAAYFAVRRGDVQTAARAVQELRDPGGDARWLYVQILVLEAAGERAGAETLRQRLRSTVTLLTPLLERALSGSSS